MFQQRMAIEISTRQAGDVTILDISGRMVGVSEGQKIHTAMTAEYEQGHHWLLLNCGGLTFIDSSGLGDVVAAHVAIIRLGGVARILDPRGTATDALVRTRLSLLLDIFSEEAAALASFNEADNRRTREKLAGV